MQNSVILPQWLDNLIFEQLGAKYCRYNADMTVIDWDKNDVLNYLGTYFPRSYAESYCIFSEFFKSIPQQFADKRELRILDFGCGTGGEMVGLLQSIDSFLPQVTHINLVGIDGNLHALRLLEKIITEYQKRTRLVISLQIAPIHIGNFYDLSVLNEIIKDQFDLILSFKAICEFVTKDQFEGANPYSHIVNTYFPYTSNSGIIVLVDVTSYNNVSNEWLPMMMDKGLASINCKIINRNDGYNYTFSIKHSRTNECFDYSKVCWRIVKQ